MEEKGRIRSVKDLWVYKLAYDSALEVFNLTRRFPKEEIYSLTDQIRRSSRSTAINIREGFAKRKYNQVFVRHLTDSIGSSEETRGWLEFSKDAGYLNKDMYFKLDKKYDEINAMLFKLIRRWQNYE